MLHRVTDSTPLRIENCLLRLNDYIHFHANTLTRNRCTTSGSEERTFAAGGHELRELVQGSQRLNLRQGPTFTGGTIRASIADATSRLENTRCLADALHRLE